LALAYTIKDQIMNGTKDEKTKRGKEEKYRNKNRSKERDKIGKETKVVWCLSPAV
jgi:hypothetical protein